MREINNRAPGDPKYKANQLEVTDPVEICVCQLKMLILTGKGEVLGDPKFGFDLEALLYELNLSEASIRKELDKQLYIYCPLFSALNGYYKLQFYVGTLRDIATLDFYINAEAAESPVITLKYS